MKVSDIIFYTLSSTFFIKDTISLFGDDSLKNASLDHPLLIIIPQLRMLFIGSIIALFFVKIADRYNILPNTEQNILFQAKLWHYTLKMVIWFLVILELILVVFKIE